MQQGLKLGILTYVHLCVNFVCVFWVNYIMFSAKTSYISGVICCHGFINGNRLFWVMLYNFCAFALQLPLGMLFDRLQQKKPWQLAAFGCVLIGIAVGIAGVLNFQLMSYTFFWIFFLCFLLGLGNALFHVGAGVRVLQIGEQLTPLGIFLSTGALGVCLGGVFSSTFRAERMYLKNVPSSTFRAESMYGERGILALLILILLLSFASAILLLLGSKMDSQGMSVHKNGQKVLKDISTHRRGQNDFLRNPVHKSGQKGFANAVMIFLLFLVVVLQSFQGSFVQFPWKKEILIALRIAAGRVLGGILADQFGIPLALLPLLLSAFLFLDPYYLLFALAAVLFFQTIMPLALSLLHERLPALPGTAFGLLSFALFVGCLPKFLSIYSGINLYENRLVIGEWSFYRFCHSIWKWWVTYQEPYVYSIVAGISFLLFVFLLCLRYRCRKER